jgi:putative peptide maturation system protein
VLERLVNVCLIQDELQHRPIDLSDDELQEAMDAFRRAHRLYKAEDTFAWMERRGMNHDQLERLVADEAIVAKLRDTVTQGRIEDYFARHENQFDIVSMARIEFKDDASAQASLAQIRMGTLDFLTAAQVQFLAVGGAATDTAQPLFTTACRGTLLEEWKPALAVASPGQVIGPLRDGSRFVLLQILSLAPARLDKATRLAIQKILFQEWLEERRRQASIEWFWGNVAQTGSISETKSDPSADRATKVL